MPSSLFQDGSPVLCTESVKLMVAIRRELKSSGNDAAVSKYQSAIKQIFGADVADLVEQERTDLSDRMLDVLEDPENMEAADPPLVMSLGQRLQRLKSTGRCTHAEFQRMSLGVPKQKLSRFLDSREALREGAARTAAEARREDAAADKVVSKMFTGRP